MIADLLTVQEAAHERGCAARTIQRAIERGRLPAFRVGRAWVIARADLEQWRPGPCLRPGLTVTAAAARLGVTPSGIRRRLREGRLTGLRYANGWIIEERALAAYERGVGGWPAGRPRKVKRQK